MRSAISCGLFLCAVLQISQAQKIVLTNDDGWAVAQIRAEFTALVNDGYDVRTTGLFSMIIVLQLLLSGRFVGSSREPVRHWVINDHADYLHRGMRIRYMSFWFSSDRI